MVPFNLTLFALFVALLSSVYFTLHNSFTSDINPRIFQQKKPSIYNDEVVVLSDCQGRISNYNYAMYAETE